MPLDTDIDLLMFLHTIEPVGIIILNNKIIGYDPYGANKLFTGRMLDLLSTMFNNDILQNDLPSKFYHLFENRKISVNEYCLTGLDELPPSPYVYMYLKFEMEIKKEGKRKIHLYKLNYNREELQMSIDLEAINFFFILANLCVDVLARYNYTYKQIKQTNQEKENKKHPHVVIINNFVLRYLKFVAEGLNKNELEPDYILSHGGVHTLMFLKEVNCVAEYFEEIVKQILSEAELSINRKYVYFTLLRCFEEYDNTIIDILNQDIGSSDYEKERGVDLARKILIQKERNKERRYYPALQNLRKELNMDGFE